MAINMTYQRVIKIFKKRKKWLTRNESVNYFKVKSSTFHFLLELVLNRPSHPLTMSQGGHMFRKILSSTLYAALITVIYFIAANIGYYLLNRRTMFADVYFYEWVEYAIVAGIMFFCTLVVELIRNVFTKKK